MDVAGRKRGFVAQRSRFFSFDPTQHGTHTRILLDEGEGPVGEPWEAQPPSAAGPVVERVTHTSFVLV